MHTPDEDEALEMLLRVPDADACFSRLRAPLREQTSTLLRGRMRRRRGMLALGFTAAYAAGLLTAAGVWLGRPANPRGDFIAENSRHGPNIAAGSDTGVASHGASGKRDPSDRPETAPAPPPMAESSIAKQSPREHRDDESQASRTAARAIDGAVMSELRPSASPTSTVPRNSTGTSTARPEPRLTRYESLRQLGDHYLQARNDPAGAARCYRLAWKAATAAEREADVETGTWLYRALARALETENSDDRQDG